MTKFFNIFSWKKNLSAIVSVAMILVLFGGIYYAGYTAGAKNPQTIEIKGITNIDSKDTKANFGIFWEALRKLREDHIRGADITDQKFVYGAIQGLTLPLNDPNTTYFPPVESKKFNEDIKGSFGGIGAEIGIKNEQLTVIAPLKNSPAEKAGLKAGDIIFKIDGSLTSGISVNDAVSKIRGLIDTQVTLNIVRTGWTAPRDFPITRGEIIIPNLDWKIKDDIMAIQLYNFDEKVPLSFYDAALNTLTSKSKGIVLDLRNNPGGFLQVAIDLAGWFLNKGEVVASETFRSGPDDVFRANGNGALKNIPLVILINVGSASASEILAGALRDNRGVKLIGDQSFGKGTVQELQNLSDGSQLKITIANWKLPSGQIIDKVGLTPDYPVTITEEDIKAKKDPQMAKALEVLKVQISALVNQ